MKILLAAAAATALLAIAAPASAETYLSAGYSNMDFDDMTLGALTFRAGVDLGVMGLGLEAEGSLGQNDDTVMVGPTAIPVGLDHAVAGYVTGTFPVGENLDIMVRAGYGRIKVSGTVPAVGGESDSINYGVGGQYNWGQNGVRFDLTRHDFRESTAGEANVWSLSYVRKF